MSEKRDGFVNNDFRSPNFKKGRKGLVIICPQETNSLTKQELQQKSFKWFVDFVQLLNKTGSDPFLNNLFYLRKVIYGTRIDTYVNVSLPCGISQTNVWARELREQHVIRSDGLGVCYKFVYANSDHTLTRGQIREFLFFLMFKQFNPQLSLLNFIDYGSDNMGLVAVATDILIDSAGQRYDLGFTIKPGLDLINGYDGLDKLARALELERYKRLTEHQIQAVMGPKGK